MQLARSLPRWWLACLLWAACEVPTSAAPRYLARAWQSEDGLPSNVVRALATTGDGYLWIGTAEGIVRFDGYRFSPLHTRGGDSLERRPIRALFPLANGEVWVATSNNLLFRGRGADLEEVPLPLPAAAGPPNPPISQVVQGPGGEVYVYRKPEVLRVVTGRPATLAPSSPELEALLQRDAAAQTERGQAFAGGPAVPGVQLRGSGGELWSFTQQEGLSLQARSGEAQAVSLPGERPAIVQAMVEDREGNVWLGTRTQGLWRLRPQRVQILTREDGLSDRTTLLVREDQAGALWVAPLSGGLDRLQPGGVEHFDVGPLPAKRAISALLETREGVIWAATHDGQVYLKSEGVFTLPFPGGQGPGKISAMAEDERGRIWFGGRFGLSYWESSSTARTKIELGSSEEVTVVVIDGSSVLVGTQSGKVYRGTDQKFQLVAPAGAFARQPISGIVPERTGGLWVATVGRGLFRVDSSGVVALAPWMSGVDLRITCLLEDSRGFLWMGTLGGIVRVEKARLQTPGENGFPVVLDRSDGLLTRECTRGGQPSGWRARDGTLFFCTGHGIARVDPQRLLLNKVPPGVTIEQVEANGVVLPMHSGAVETGPGRSRLEFLFGALSFTAPEKVRFRTRLAGLDDTWREGGGARSVSYASVPPGRYRFQVKAENGDGVWNEVGASLDVMVRPLYWETRWFRAAVAISAVALAVGVGALVTRARMRGRLLRMEAQTSREKERARIAQDLHDDLGASLTEITLLANLALEERPPLESGDDTLPEVAAKAQELVGVLDEIVWAVNPRHDTLRSLVEYLAAYGGTFLRRAGITLRRDVPHELPEMSLDAERRHHIFLTLREALNNTVKHSRATEVWLRVRLHGQLLQIAIEDNGRGLPAHVDEFSEGLRGMRVRMQRIGGACQIQSKGQGTEVLLSLPLSSRAD